MRIQRDKKNTERREWWTLKSTAITSCGNHKLFIDVGNGNHGKKEKRSIISLESRKQVTPSPLSELCVPLSTLGVALPPGGSTGVLTGSP